MTDAALGNLMLRLSDAKRRRTTLLASLEEQGRMLWNFGHNLKELHQILTLNDDIIPRCPDGYASREALEAVLDDLRAVCQDIALAHTQLANAGIDVS